MTTTISIEGMMSIAQCRESIKEVAGVTEVTVSLENKMQSRRRFCRSIKTGSCRCRLRSDRCEIKHFRKQILI